jgi:N utilization substance protein B
MNHIDNTFPLSRNRTIRGSRRLAREKALQVLTAYFISETPWEESFEHIFNREFNFGDEEQTFDKLLTPDEIIEVEADSKIDWQKDEYEFSRNLIIRTLLNRQEADSYISSVAENWELDRIAIIDRILIEMSVIELLTFEEIPTKVSINEAIEISKLYSTDKSSTFINGVLDKIAELLSTEGKIKKQGRGLNNE